MVLVSRTFWDTFDAGIPAVDLLIVYCEVHDSVAHRSSYLLLIFGHVPVHSIFSKYSYSGYLNHYQSRMKYVHGTLNLFSFIKILLETDKMSGAAPPIQCRCRQGYGHSGRGLKFHERISKKVHFSSFYFLRKSSL